MSKKRPQGSGQGRPEGSRKIHQSVRVNITLPKIVYEQMRELIKRQGFFNPSDYVRNKIREDAKAMLGWTGEP